MKPIENDILLKKLKSLANQLADHGTFKERGIQEDRQLPFSFVVYSLQRQIENYSLDEILPSITDGAGDQDIDIFHIEEDDRRVDVSLFQVKFKQDTNLQSTIGEKEVESFLSKVRKLMIDADPNLPKPNPYLAQKYKEFIALSKSSEIEALISLKWLYSEDLLLRDRAFQ